MTSIGETLRERLNPYGPRERHSLWFVNYIYLLLKLISIMTDTVVTQVHDFETGNEI